MTGHGKAGGHLPSSGRALTISGWLTGIYFVIELAIGLYTGSIAVISDAFHTFSAVGGVLLAIVGSALGASTGRFRTDIWLVPGGNYWCVDQRCFPACHGGCCDRHGSNAPQRSD